MKKTISLLLCIVMTIYLLSTGALAQAGLTNFQKSNTYAQGKFTDVASTDWFVSNVRTAYEYNLMQGMSSNYFGADSYVTLAEVVTMAARLHSIYITGSASFASSTPWYQTYVDYAVANGIITKGRFEDYTISATRFQVAEIFAAALPEAALPAINKINVGQIPDVSLETSYAGIYLLYRAGVLTGKNAAGSFGPADKVLRKEVAAVVSRMAVASLRVNFTIDSSAAGSVTTVADLLRALDEARSFIQLAIKSYTSAEYYLLVTSSETAGFAALDSASEYTQQAAQRAQGAAAFCKANSKYASVYDSVNTVYLGCIQASKLITAVAAAPLAASTDWDKVLTVLDACGETVSGAYTSVSAIG